MAESYAALNADQNQIRLLHLAPAAEKGSVIECRFTVASLDHRPHFEALSYVWGDSKGSHFVQHGDRIVPVTDNLFAALRRLRSRDSELTLWVDALCINQSDLDEKMHQVSRMADIFQQAAQVIVWLDEGWEGSDQTINFLCTIAEDASVHLDPSLHPHATAGGNTLESAELRNHLCRLFSLAWWKRTWTIQEFVLAQDLVFQCGLRRISRRTMYLARENFWAHKDRCCPPRLFDVRDQETGMSLQAAFEVPARLDYISKSRGDCYSVLTPIATFCGSGVTDSRDRVYGMLGLGTGPYSKLVNPNYYLAPEQVCVEVALRSLERTGKFEFLSHLFEHQNKKLPSFVPNWTGQFKWFDIYSLWLRNVRNFHASGNTMAQYRLHDRGILAVQGVIVDRVVASCYACLIDRIRDPDYLAEFLELACPNNSFQEPYADTNEPCLLALWQTLNGGMHMVLEDSNRYQRRLRGSTDVSRFFKFVEFMTSEHRAELWSTEIEHILLDIETGTRSRSLFRTQNGLLGIGPGKCQVDDSVVVLLGGNMPYIVRDAPNRLSTPCFTISGDAYVHGIMDGEALLTQDGSPKELTEIVLV